MNQQAFLFYRVIGIFFPAIFYCSCLYAADLEVTKLKFFDSSLNDSSGLASHGGGYSRAMVYQGEIVPAKREHTSESRLREGSSLLPEPGGRGRSAGPV